MSQHKKLALLLSIITLTTLLVQQSTASCGVCGDNGIACISETQFYICFGSQPDNRTVFECPNQGTCTALLSKCSEAQNAPADCTPTTPTNTCGCTASSGMFACTSRTTFDQCNGDQIVVANVSCPANTVCAATRGGAICVDSCRLEGQIECNLDAPAS